MLWEFRGDLRGGFFDSPREKGVTTVKGPWGDRSLGGEAAARS